jgi:uncharacterized integral membrane protein
MKLSHRVLLGLVSVLLVAVLLLAVQNSGVVELRFLGWAFSTSVLGLILGSALVGGLFGAAVAGALAMTFRPRR